MSRNVFASVCVWLWFHVELFHCSHKDVVCGYFVLCLLQIRAYRAKQYQAVTWVVRLQLLCGCGCCSFFQDLPDFFVLSRL